MALEPNVVSMSIPDALKLAVDFCNTGQLQSAEAICKQVLGFAPGHPDALHLAGVIALHTKKYEEAAASLERAAALAPQVAEYRYNLGLARKELGRLEEAAACFAEAARLAPQFVQARYNLANAMLDLERLDEAEAGFREVLAAQPKNAAALNNLGRALEMKGRLDEGAGQYRAAIAADPEGAAEAYVNLGKLLHTEYRLEEAIRQFSRAIELKPELFPAQHNLALALKESGRAELAAQVFNVASMLKKDDAESQFQIGLALVELGRMDEAAARFREVIRLNPERGEGHVNLGVALQERGRMEEAILCYQRAMELKPGLPEIQNNLGVIFHHLGQFARAEECLEKALGLKSEYGHAHCNLGNVDKDIGRIDEAIAHYRQCIAFEPDYADAYSNLLLSLNYSASVSRKEVFEEHREWAKRYEAPLAAKRKAHPNARDPERRLRVGYVSPDYRRHSVAFFIEPLLRHHDRAHFEVFCYSNTLNVDGITPRLMGLADQARNILGMSDERVTELVRADGIDILVDLAGHTAKGRMRLFARKPAPVQAIYLGYPNTSGLEAIDWRITDVHADPPGDGDEFHSERLARLPETFLCYQPPAESTDVRPAPMGKNGHVTFGSFNLLAKATPQVIALWAELLRRLPESRLLLKAAGLGETLARAHVTGEFAKHGIGEERLVLFGKDRDFAAHMARYHEVDIGLDPFPYNGTTTTYDALWMGVPVVTLATDRHAGRVGKSILENLGLPELIAQSESEYLDICLRLAGDLSKLDALRSGMRERMRASPLLDGARLTRNIEAAYRDMWRRYCAA